MRDGWNYFAEQCGHLYAHFERDGEILEENTEAMKGVIVYEL